MAKSVKIAVILIILSLVINLGVNIFDLIFNKLAMLDFILSTVALIPYVIISYFLLKGSLIARRFYVGLSFLMIVILISLITYIHFTLKLSIIDNLKTLEIFDTLQTVIITLISLYLLFIPQDAKSFFSK